MTDSRIRSIVILGGGTAGNIALEQWQNTR